MAARSLGVLLCLLAASSSSPAQGWPGRQLSSAEGLALDRLVAVGGMATSYGWGEIHVSFPEQCLAFHQAHGLPLGFRCGYGADHYPGRQAAQGPLAMQDVVTLTGVVGIVGVDLCGTGLGDGVLDPLATIAPLRYAELRGTRVTRSALDAFRAKRPDVTVHE